MKLNNKKCIVSIIFIAIYFIVIGNISFVAYAEQDEESVYIEKRENFDVYYEDSDIERTNQFVYSDNMLLGNSEKMSTDLAKVSVSLACATYNQEYIRSAS